MRQGEDPQARNKRGDGSGFGHRVHEARSRKKVQDDADLLEYIRKYSTETLAQMAEGTGLSTSTLSRRLKEFKDQGAVERVGGRRSGFWTVRIEDR